MKRKVYIKTAIVLLLIILILIVLSTTTSMKILTRSTDYIVKSENGFVLPVQVFKIKDKGYRLFVMEGENQKLSSIVFFPEDKAIGLPNGRKEDFTFLFNKYAIQWDKNHDSFKILYFAGKFTTGLPNDYFPIKSVQFDSDKLEFNSFGNLKSYGKKVILKKI